MGLAVDLTVPRLGDINLTSIVLRLGQKLGQKKWLMVYTNSSFASSFSENFPRRRSGLCRVRVYRQVMYVRIFFWLVVMPFRFLGLYRLPKFQRPGGAFRFFSAAARSVLGFYIASATPLCTCECLRKGKPRTFQPFCRSWAMVCTALDFTVPRADWSGLTVPVFVVWLV